MQGGVDIATQAWARIVLLDEPGADWFERAAEFSRKRGEARAQIPPRQRLLLADLGNVWFDLRELAQARQLYERALRIEEAAYGPDHPEAAITLGNLGNVWRQLGELASARELFERALRIQHAHFPSGHPFTDDVASNLHKVAPDLVVLKDGRVARQPGGPTSDT
jgi:tetratricopeptide (TPR) repeat protein